MCLSKSRVYKRRKWFLRTQKTKDLIEIPLNDFALEILNKYFDKGLALPTISKEYSNKYLKELGRMANISELITITRYIGAERVEETKPKYELISNHMSRRTFVTLF